MAGSDVTFNYLQTPHTSSLVIHMCFTRKTSSDFIFKLKINIQSSEELEKVKTAEKQLNQDSWGSLVLVDVLAKDMDENYSSEDRSSSEAGWWQRH